MTKTHLLIRLFFLQFLVIKGQFNATYGFINVAPGTGVTDPGPFPSHTGIEFLPMKAFGVSAQPSAAGRFAFNNWPLGAINGDDDLVNFTGNLSGLSYYEIWIRVNEGFVLDLQQISFSMRRSSTGCRNFCLRCNRDNFTTNLSASTGTNENIQVLPDQSFFWKYDSLSTSEDQKGCALTSLGIIQDSICFRWYAWNAETSGGSFSLDNLTFSGKLGQLSGVGKIGTNTAQIEIDLNLMAIRLSEGGRANWSLYDIGGALVQQDLDQEYIFYTNLKSGLYWLKCEVGGKVIWKKITKTEN